MSIPIFVLTTRGSSRSDKLLESLKSQGLSAQVIFSLDARKEIQKVQSLKKHQNIYKYTIGRDIAASELACAYGHELIRERILDSNHLWALVLEDDVTLSSEFYREITILISGSANPRIIQLASTAQTNRLRSSLFFNSGQSLLECISPPSGTLGYLINYSAAKIYHEIYLRHGITSTADWPYPQPRSVKFLISSKALVFENPEIPSLINDDRREIISANTYCSYSFGKFSRIPMRILKGLSLGFKFRDLIFVEISLRLRLRLAQKNKLK